MVVMEVGSLRLRLLLALLLLLLLLLLIFMPEQMVGLRRLQRLLLLLLVVVIRKGLVRPEHERRRLARQRWRLRGQVVRMLGDEWLRLILAWALVVVVVLLQLVELEELGRGLRWCIGRSHTRRPRRRRRR